VEFRGKMGHEWERSTIRDIMEVDRREEKGCVIEAVYMIKVHYMHL
jgi:hypothetical protein